MVPRTPATAADRVVAMLPPGLTPRLAAIYAGLAALGLVALGVGLLLYAGAAQKDSAQRIAAADRAIADVTRDQARVPDLLAGAFEPEKGPESPTKNYDANAVRQQIKDVQPGLDSAARTIGVDQGAIRTALTTINDRGLRALTSGSQLDKKAAALEAVGHALDVRQEELTTARQQLTLLGDLTTAQENFGGLTAALDKADLITATTRFTPANNAIQQTVVDAQAASTPDAVRTYVNQVSAFMDATQSVINSLTAHDFGEYTASLRVFTTRFENLANYDPKVVRQQYDDLVKSYNDRYNGYIHDAGLPTGTKSL